MTSVGACYLSPGLLHYGEERLENVAGTAADSKPSTKVTLLYKARCNVPWKIKRS